MAAVDHVLVRFADPESKLAFSEYLARSTIYGGEVYLIIDAVKTNGSFHGNIDIKR